LRRINNIDDANIAHNSLARDADLKRTKDWDFKKLKIRNASPAEDDFDYTTLNQLNPQCVWNINNPAVGQNITTRIICTAQPGVRILRWMLTINVAPTGGSNIYDIRKLPINITDLTKGVSIFPDGNTNKIIHPAGAIRADGYKFHHIPFDLMYREELMLDVLAIGTTAGTGLYLTLVCQRI